MIQKAIRKNKNKMSSYYDQHFFFGTGGSVFSKYQNKIIINAYVYCMKVLYSLPILMLVYILTETK